MNVFVMSDKNSRLKKPIKYCPNACQICLFLMGINGVNKEWLLGVPFLKENEKRKKKKLKVNLWLNNLYDTLVSLLRKNILNMRVFLDHLISNSHGEMDSCTKQVMNATLRIILMKIYE